MTMAKISKLISRDLFFVACKDPKPIVFLFLVFLLVKPVLGTPPSEIILATNGQAKVRIIESQKPTTVQKFATTELRRYLNQITGAEFLIIPNNSTQAAAVRIEIGTGSATEGYSILVRGKDIILRGNSDRRWFL